MAAVAAARSGKTIKLVEPTAWIGGMVAGGLSGTDAGNSAAIGGIALEFFKRNNATEVAAGAAPNNIYVGEPHVFRNTFLQMLSESNVEHTKSVRLAAVQKTGTKITSVTLTDGSRHAAKIFIDASYEGDLMAMAGVAYAVGRESRATYNEPDAGTMIPRELFNGTFDPYVTPKNPNSGLIFEVVPGPVLPEGSADHHVMAYNYRSCATDIATHSNNAIPFAQLKPKDYDPAMFLGALRLVKAIGSSATGEYIARHFLNPQYVQDSNPEKLIPYAAGKFDINGGSPYSTDVVGVTDGYADGDEATRQKIRDRVRAYDQGLFYYLATSSDIPDSVHEFIHRFGACADEFTDNDHFPTQLYIREGRRMRGAYVMTEFDILKQVPPPHDVIGIGDYNMDSHIHQLVDVDGKVCQEGSGELKGYTQYGIKPGTLYPIPYRALTPNASEATNLLVSVTVSASSMAIRSLRMEPQYMMMGHAAGAAASLAIDDNVDVQNVDYSKMEARLKTEKQVLAY